MDEKNSTENTTGIMDLTGSEGGLSVNRLAIIALAIAMNVIGGHIALLLHLPVYLDSMGTILIAVLYGPVYGIIPPLLYGLVMGFTIDVFSLYYMPVGLILGLTTGMAAGKLKNLSKKRPLWVLVTALVITIPATILSSLITAYLFGGITSSGSTVLVQLFNKAGLGMTASVFVVQILTDYLDRLISLIFVSVILRRLPADLY